ncbi:inositol monophosphatase family protein [Virgibacillus alimentarius]|uniref:Myo-inositol-1(Or 4)-monophosphatase n=1 Tax=Virgibacillus alimentarius TaxID=698769 RepID=A0ABS4SCW0_9BACI|nr:MULTISPECIES: inositol monophosphatase family protein [Virgibacillus]MBP2259172.1 myo-inositol-1(or 4)-monophosphatase [Virgibacillus alimentarius]HLR66016.1 inositol monophosphatase family protein [Virgibacillus sp.]
MDKSFRESLFNHAKEWVLEAGAYIRNNINEPLTIDTKSNPNDLVTTMDKETEQYFSTKIKKTYPNHFILSEEGFGDDLSSLDGIVWILDPIDGTMNFVHQKRNFAISLGIYQDGIGEIGFIYDVMSDVLYSAKKGEGAYKNDVKLGPVNENVALEDAILVLNHFWLTKNRLVDEHVMQDLVKRVRGTRTYGSAALEFAYVAEGIIDGYLSMRLAPWDIGAGIILLKEVGGRTTTIDGNSVQLLEKNSIFACSPKLGEKIVEEYIKKGKK